VYKGNGDYMFSLGYGREFKQDIGDTYVSPRPTCMSLKPAIHHPLTVTVAERLAGATRHVASWGE
jgi:hypothetical protein